VSDSRLPGGSSLSERDTLFVDGDVVSRHTTDVLGESDLTFSIFHLGEGGDSRDVLNCAGLSKSVEGGNGSSVRGKSNLGAMADSLTFKDGSWEEGSTISVSESDVTLV